MGSPFPGMDPFIEGQVWPGFHTEFIVELQRALTPRLRPRYFVYVEQRVYVEHTPENGGSVIVPEVTVGARPHAEPAARRARGAVLDAPVTVPSAMPTRTREAFLEVRLRNTGAVVTVLELLSPTNKGGYHDGRREYLAKRDSLLQSDAHLVEMDLLRGGERMPMAGDLPPAQYYVVVSRAERRPLRDVWHITLRRPLPTIRVPLREPDADVSLDLQTVFNAVYDGAGYADYVDYSMPCEPPLALDDDSWARE